MGVGLWVFIARIKACCNRASSASISDIVFGGGVEDVLGLVVVAVRARLEPGAVLGWLDSGSEVSGFLALDFTAAGRLDPAATSWDGVALAFQSCQSCHLVFY